MFSIFSTSYKLVAAIAWPVEQLICNYQLLGSTLGASTINLKICCPYGRAIFLADIAEEPFRKLDSYSAVSRILSSGS